MNKHTLPRTASAPAPLAQTGANTPASRGSLASHSDGYGNQPRCITCRKGVSNCYCHAEEGDDLPAADCVRIMRTFAPILDLDVTRNADGSAGVRA